jgi:hypothetical protein
MWLDPADMAPLRDIQTLTLGLFESTPGELRTLLRGFDQLRALNIYRMKPQLVAQILQPFRGNVLFPSLAQLKYHTYDPPELARSVAHDRGRWNVIVFKGKS